MNTKKILFLTLVKINSLKDSNIYSDLAEELSKKVDITILCPHERRYGYKSMLKKKGKAILYQQFSLNNQKTGKIEKALSIFLLEFFMVYAFLKKFKNNKYDILLISTPPIFVYKFIKIFKWYNPEAKIYLLLKDIFPQNAVELGMIRNSTFFYKYSRQLEQKIYKYVDKIGCMSVGNVEYIRQHNPSISYKLEINPNSLNVDKYPPKKNLQVKSNNVVLRLIYGGNLGLPQDPVLICNFIEAIEKIENVKFTICGSGTGFSLIYSFLKKNSIKKTELIEDLSKIKYLSLLEASSIGLIFLNNKFTIPNYPSRILDYLRYNLTIISITDPNTDLTRFISEHDIGYSFTNEKGQIQSAISTIKSIQEFGTLKEYDGELLVKKYFNVKNSADKILNLLESSELNFSS